MAETNLDQVCTTVECQHSCFALAIRVLRLVEKKVTLKDDIDGCDDDEEDEEVNGSRKNEGKERERERERERKATVCSCNDDMYSHVFYMLWNTTVFISEQTMNGSIIISWF